MPHTKRVFDHFEKELIPSLKWLGIKSMLYVGWRHDCKPWWHDYMAKELGVERLGVLEIFSKNVHDLEQANWSGRYRCGVIQGDAREPEKYLSEKWDLIFWDHGPEHVDLSDLQKSTERLFDCAQKVLLYCCPWGDWPQGEEDGNVHEVHRNSVTKEQLESLGLNVITFGAVGQMGEGELVALRQK